MHALPVSGATRAISRSYAWERFHALDSEGGATPDVPGHASSSHASWMQLYTWVQAVVWPLLMHGMFSNSRGCRVGTSESLLVLLEAVR